MRDRNKQKGEIHMKKLSKIGLLILAFALICAGLVMSVSGSEGNDEMVSYVDDAGNTKEGTLSDAWQNAATDTGTGNI